MEQTKNAPKPVIALRVAPDVRVAAFALAEEQGRTVSALVSEALAAYLAQHRSAA